VPLLDKQWIFRRSRAEVAKVVRDGMRFRAESEAWSPAEKQAHMMHRLREVLRHAQRQTIYYKRVFSSIDFNAEDEFSFADFAKLPILEREDAIASERDLIARDIDPAGLRLDSTGGSTGQPVRVWLGPKELGWRRSGTDFYQRRIGVLPGKKLALLWGHHLDPVRSRSFKDRILALIQNHRWFDCFRLSPEVLERWHAELQSWRPDCIIAYAGALASLAEYVLSHGYKPAYPRVCSVTGAEKLFPQQRHLVEQAFGKVYERYGSRDVGLIAFQADSKGDAGLEVDWANVLVEPASSEPDSGVLVTKLNADGMPMIRYRMGDIARFPAGSRPGQPTFFLRDVLGRATDRIWLPTGQWIAGVQFPHLMKDHPVREFMLVQRPDHSLDLQIVPITGFGEHDRQAIEATISANLPGLPLRIALVQQVERNHSSKLRPVVSEVRRLGTNADATT
jgi:phenylacetate-CoA ligase